MRKFAVGLGCGLALVVCALLGARGPEKVKLHLQLLDAEDGKKLGGMVRVFPRDGKEPVELPGLLDRLRGLKKTDTLRGWYVVPAGGVAVALPRGRYRVEALSGLETAKASQDLDLTAEPPDALAVKLTALFRPEVGELVAGNTHLHLQGLTRDECDEYLRQVPAADGIRVQFISYLERAEADRNYVTNRYPVGDLAEFEGTSVLYNNGEEHRHNFTGFGQGYGHVMFLGIKELVKPVSLGPGITGSGDDDRALRPGIEEARRQGGTVIWCHNTNGHEGIPSALAGRFHALNVFDGSRTGTYEDKYYRYLNIGLRLPISTGTDWFVHDFSRVYARVPGKLTVGSWLAALREGRTVATNGPLLSLTVDGKAPGDTLKLAKPGRLRVAATGSGRHDFGKLQLVHNGRVIRDAAARKDGGGFTARLERDVAVDGPGWFAVRIESDATNELDQKLFAHSSPVYVELAGERFLDVESGRTLLRQMEEGRQDIRTRGKFSSAAARDRLLANYDDAIRDLTERIGRRSR